MCLIRWDGCCIKPETGWANVTLLTLPVFVSFWLNTRCLFTAVGVGGLQAEAVTLGQPVSMATPHVLGYRLTGDVSCFVTSTDIVLTIIKVRLIMFICIVYVLACVIVLLSTGWSMWLCCCL